MCLKHENKSGTLSLPPSLPCLTLATHAPNAPPDRLVQRAVGRETIPSRTVQPAVALFHRARTRLATPLIVELALEFDLQVLRARERNANANHGARTLIGEINALRYLAAINGKKDGAALRGFARLDKRGMR